MTAQHRIGATRRRACGFFVAVAAALIALGASAAPRTFVATSGNDANPCSLAAPCRSFATALVATDPAGEIVALESGGYGRITVNKSVAIIAPPGVYAALSVFAGDNGIDINTAGVKVILRGLTINGQGGVHGIAFTAGAQLNVDNCVIANMGSDGLHATASGADVFVTETTITNNAQDGIELSDVRLFVDSSHVDRNGGYGIFATAATAATRVSIARSTLSGNIDGGAWLQTDSAVFTTEAQMQDIVIAGNGNGVEAVSTANGAVRAHLTRAAIFNNGFYGVRSSSLAGSTTLVTLTDSDVNGNGNEGARVAGSGATIVVGGSTVTRNASFGFRQTDAGSSFQSKKDNMLRDNNGGGVQTDGTITALTLE
jgi:hypothetical protein